MKNIITATILTVSALNINANTPQLVEQIVETSSQAEVLKSKYNAEIAASSTTNNLTDPEVEFEHHWGQKGIGNKWGVGISQGFEWPGVYTARSSAAKLMRNASLSAYENDLNELRLKVKLLLIDLCHANCEISLLDSVNSSLTGLLDKYRVSFDNGETTILDVKKIEIELLGATRQLNDAILVRDEILGRLRGISPDFDWNSVESIDSYPRERAIMTEAEYAEMLRRCDNQGRFLSDMKELSHANVKVQRNAAMPGFSLGYRHDYELGERFNGLSVALTIPLFSNRNKVKAAVAEAYSYEAAVVNRNETLNAEWAAMRQQAIKLKDECERYSGILESADTGRLLKLALDGGEISLLNYLQESAYFKQAQRDYLTAEYQFHTVLAKLNRYFTD